MQPGSGEPHSEEPESYGGTPAVSRDEEDPPLGTASVLPENDPASGNSTEIGWQGIGSTIGRALDAYGSALVLFLALSTPVAILTALTVVAGSNVAAVIAAAIVLTVTALVTGAAMTFATDDLGRGVPPGIADVLDRAAGRAVPVILATLAFGAVIVGLTVVISIAAIIVGVVAVASDSAVLGVVTIVIVVPAAIVAVVVLSVRWGLSIQAIVLGGLGPLEGLRRSRSLTRGHVMRLVGLYFALGLFTILPSVGASLLTTFAVNRAFAAVGLAVSTLLTSPLFAIALAIAYQDLAGRPEGAGAVLPRGNGRGAALTTVLGAGIIVLVAGIWAATSAGGQIYLPERGQVVAGASRNALDPCHPDGIRATFESSEEIWIAAIFTSGVPAGGSIVIEYSLDGTILGSAPLTAGAQGLQCYYETDPIVGASPGTYRITVRYGSAVVADGNFTVR